MNSIFACRGLIYQTRINPIYSNSTLKSTGKLLYFDLFWGNKNWEWWRGDARFWRRVAKITHGRTTPK
jgi:hypothetical protein